MSYNNLPSKKVAKRNLLSTQVSSTVFGTVANNQAIPDGLNDGDILIWNAETEKWEITDFVTFTDSNDETSLLLKNNTDSTTKKILSKINDTNTDLQIQGDLTKLAIINNVLNANQFALYIHSTGSDYQFSVLQNGKITTYGGIRIDIASKGIGKFLKCIDANGNSEWADAAALPSGTANQILRHNGTNWVVANYTTLTDTSTSSKLAIVNGANPTGKNAYIEVDDTYSRLWLQNDNTAPFGGANYVNIYSTQDKAWIALSGFGGQDLIMLLRNDAEGYLKIGNQNGENVFVGAKDYPSTTNENIYIEDGSLVKTFIVTNNGKLFTKQHPQIDTTEAASGKVLVCTDNDGNSQWQKKSDLILQTSDLNLTINPTNNIYYVLGWDALANKNYKFEYGLNIRWYNDNELANLFTFQIKIGEEVPTEICYAYGNILVNGQAASLLDQHNLNAYIDMTTTDAKWNILDNAGYIFKIEGILKMGSTNKTITMKIITTGTEDAIAIQPYLQQHSYLKYEMF